MIRAFISLFAAVFVLSACAGAPEGSLPPSERLNVGLVEAFQGRTTGRGVFKAPIAGVERPFNVVLNGRLRGNTLTVAEDFVFDDGQVDRLTWRFTRVGAGRWTGTREDVIGEAEVLETPEGIVLTYTADIRGADGNTTRLSFRDILYKRADGVVINEAVVSSFGLPIGSVYLEIKS